jgi:hypothetical protein
LLPDLLALVSDGLVEIQDTRILKSARRPQGRR